MLAERSIVMDLHRQGVRAAVIAMVLMGAAASPAGTPDETAFLAENDAAMKKMMADMAITPSGDVDRDFVTMMIPHHQGAVDMALAYLRYGHNEQLRRLAQEIIVTQGQEITVMRLAICDNSRGDSDATHNLSQPATHQRHSLQ
jgi:uncharacterized protein (DUF305 family)